MRGCVECGRSVKVILGPHFKLFANVSCASWLSQRASATPYLYQRRSSSREGIGIGFLEGGFNILGAQKVT